MRHWIASASRRDGGTKNGWLIPMRKPGARNLSGNPGFQPWRAGARIHSGRSGAPRARVGEIQHRITEICALQSRHWCSGSASHR